MTINEAIERAAKRICDLLSSENFEDEYRQIIHEELDPYWNDITDHLSQLRWILDEQMEVVNGLSDTIDTLASHRIDEVVRVLTVVTVLTLPLTVLATIFGMNVALPYAEHPLLFFVVVGLGLTLTIVLVRYLRGRRWL